MISAFANSLKVPDLRQRILFTLAIIVIVRLGVHIPLPGIGTGVLEAWTMSQASKQQGSTALGAILTIFSGGGLQQCGLFALGIMPYISASIMVQILTVVLPQWSKLSREEGGRQKITKYTRMIAIGIAIIQGGFLAVNLENPQNIPYLQGIQQFGQLVVTPGWTFIVSMVITITAGTMFLMWLGDQITEKGIGNGVSLIIAVNIISALPGAVAVAWKQLVYNGGAINPLGSLKLVALIAFLILVVAAVVTVTQAQRRIVVQYAKRVVGNKETGAPTQYLPLKLNYAGVMPIIFATAILSLPFILLNSMFPNSDFVIWCSTYLSAGSSVYYIVSSALIFFFSYFWVATMFQPAQIAEDLKRNGGYIPGIRPGEHTTRFLDTTMGRLTFAGSIFLTMIFFLPYIVQTTMSLDQVVGQFFGGTSLLILVGVLLDMMRQVETTLLQRNYDGFLRKGKKLRGKYDRRQGTGTAANTNTVVIIWAVISVLFLLGIIAYMVRK